MGIFEISVPLVAHIWIGTGRLKLMAGAGIGTVAAYPGELLEGTGGYGFNETKVL